MEKKTYGFAIIGCGVIANIHAAAIARVENAKLIGVYDFSLERASAVDFQRIRIFESRS